MFRSLVVLFVVLLLPIPSWAAVVLKVKGKSVLIDLKGDPATTGDSFFAVTPSGKRVGLIRIAKVKGEKAIGRISKGRAQSGMTLELQPASVNAGTGKSKAPRARSENVASGRSYWGGLFGYARDSMSVNVLNSINNTPLEKVSLSGSGFSAKALFDYELFPQIWFRGTSGLEMLKVSGPSRCGTLNREACTVDINYLTIDLLGRYVFSNGQYRPWLGGGVGLLFPMSKSSSALKAESISTTNVIMFTGGLDYFVSPNLFIPVSLEYGLLPKSDEVEANWIAFRVGFGVPF